MLEVQAELSAVGATAILGRNGSGKTSLLRAIAGLDHPTGKIYVNETKWLDTPSNVATPTRERKLGYVSQTPKLFPHMTVNQNLQFAYRLATKRGERDSTRALADLIARFELKTFLERKPATLSGGETSRVVLARALLSDPDLLLLDEPLASIDTDRKRDLLPHLEAILADRPLPMLYVTHDFSEVARLCANALVLRAGKVVSYGRTNAVVQSISDSDLPVQAEKSSIVTAKYESYDESFFLAYFKIADQSIAIPMSVQPNFRNKVPIRVQERDVAIATSKPENTSMRNVLLCKVLEIETPLDSPFSQILLICGTEKFRARITRASMIELGLEKDTEVFALIKSVSLEV